MQRKRYDRLSVIPHRHMAVLLLAPIALLPKHASGVHQWPAWVLTPLIALPVQAFVHHPFIRNEPLLQRMR